MKKASERLVLGKYRHPSLRVAGCAARQVISGWVSVGARFSVTCLRESVEIDGPDMGGPRQRGGAENRGGDLAAARRARVCIVGDIWSRRLWESICDVPSSSLGTEQGNSGELRMGDGGWSCLEPSRMNAFFSGTYRHRRKFDPGTAESLPRAKYSMYY